MHGRSVLQQLFDPVGEPAARNQRGGLPADPATQPAETVTPAIWDISPAARSTGMWFAQVRLAACACVSGPKLARARTCAGSSPSLTAWLRRLRGSVEPLRQHAIGELNGLGSYPPGPPSEPAGSPLGDALNAVAAAVDCARRNFGHGPEMTWPLAGRLAWPASSCSPPPADHLPSVPGTAIPAAGPATLTAASCTPRRDTVTRSPPP